MNQAIRNALDDLETAACSIEENTLEDYSAYMIRESVKTIREELEDNERPDVTGNRIGKINKELKDD